jgi:hypothetical protein
MDKTPEHKALEAASREAEQLLYFIDALYIEPDLRKKHPGLRNRINRVRHNLRIALGASYGGPGV